MKYTLMAACAALVTISVAASGAPVQLSPAAQAALKNAHLIDIVAPQLVSTAPATGAVGVPVTANLRLTFSENIKAGPGGGFNLWVAGGGMTVLSNTNASIVTYSGANLYINPPGTLAHHTTYYLTWPQGAVTDMAGNKDPGNGSATLLRFTTAP